MERSIRMGVVGLGLMGEVHVRVYQSLEGVEVVGCVEPNQARAAAIQERYNVKIFSEVNELLRHVDAISICTPDHMHKETILAAFRQGVKVLVEKPLDVSSTNCQEILAAMPDETFLMVGHVLRFDPRVWRAKQILDGGELGKILSVKVWRSNSMASGRKIGQRTSVTWFLGIHDVDMVLWLLNQPKITNVQAMGAKVFTPYWDYVSATLQTEAGTIVSVENGWILPVERVTGLDAGIQITGEQGMIEVNLTHADVRVTSAQRGRSMLMDTFHWPEIGGELQGDLRIELEAFVRAVRYNEIPPVTAKEAAAAVDIVERIEKALEQ